MRHHQRGSARSSSKRALPALRAIAEEASNQDQAEEVQQESIALRAVAEAGSRLMNPDQALEVARRLVDKFEQEVGPIPSLTDASVAQPAAAPFTAADSLAAAAHKEGFEFKNPGYPKDPDCKWREDWTERRPCICLRCQIRSTAISRQCRKEEENMRLEIHLDKVSGQPIVLSASQTKPGFCGNRTRA